MNWLGDHSNANLLNHNKHLLTAALAWELMSSPCRARHRVHLHCHIPPSFAQIGASLERSGGTSSDDKSYQEVKISPWVRAFHSRIRLAMMSLCLEQGFGVKGTQLSNREILNTSFWGKALFHHRKGIKDIVSDLSIWPVETLSTDVGLLTGAQGMRKIHTARHYMIRRLQCVS